MDARRPFDSHCLRRQHSQGVTSHALVLVLLFTAFRHTAAFQSVGAMTFRLVTWIAILALLWFRR